MTDTEKLLREAAERLGQQIGEWVRNTPLKKPKPMDLESHPTQRNAPALGGAGR